MKKAFALAAAFALAFSLAGCGGASSAASPSSAVSAGSGAASASASQSETGGEPVELTVFAAASLTETLNQIAEDYKTVAPNVTLTFNFDSSGTLKTQIQEGAVCDVFLSAGQKQMDQLDKTADASVNTEGLDFVAEGTRVNLLENKVALCVAEGSDAAITSFDDLAKALEGSVDCGVVYCTDAYSAGITPVDYATEEMCGQVIYPAAVLNVSQHSEEAQAFLDYLQTDAAMQVFEEVGFSPVI